LTPAKTILHLFPVVLRRLLIILIVTFLAPVEQEVRGLPLGEARDRLRQGWRQGPIAQAGNKWQRIKYRNGIKVYKKTGKKQHLVTFKGTGVIEAKLFYVLAVLADVENTHKWVETVKRVKILERINDKELITYTTIKMPWPMQDRDSVAHGKVSFKSDGWVHITSKNTKHSVMPPNDNYVRIAYMRAKWSFKQVKNGKATWAEFTVLADPGGLIPHWVVNWAANNVPYKSIMNLRKRVRLGKFNSIFVEKNRRFLEEQ